MKIDGCRSCGAERLAPVIDLGEQPLANALPRAQDADEDTFPLAVVRCEACSLVQLTHTVPPEVLFRDYLYFSSYSDTVLANARSVATRLVRERALGPQSLVVEIASNDGYLLQFFKETGVPVLGVEPARNVARVAEERGIPTVSEFFDEALAEALREKNGGADVILANNVLAHVAGLNGVVAGVAKLLKPDGVAVVEVPYVKDLLDHREFDTIYHEHLCYFSVTALRALVERHGLVLQDVERIPIHGGSLRLFIQHSGTTPTARVEALLAEESAWGVAEDRGYAEFERAVTALRRDLTALLRRLKAEGRTLAGYGAAAKCTVLTNYCGIDATLLDFVVDRSPHKQGRYVPGARIPIVAPQALLERQPDYVVLFAWNFTDEIVRQQSEYLERGGRFIRPVPTPSVVPTA